MSETQVSQLARLYFGTLVEPGQRSSPTPSVIARTPDVTPVHATDCLQKAQLPPPARHEVTADMPGALGLFRGEVVDFILASAQYNDAGYPQILYLLVPLDVLRRLGGNVLAFRPLGLMTMPSFAAIKTNLAPYDLPSPAPPSVEEQTKALFDLIVDCHDSFKLLEHVLAGLVQGWPLVIVNSPVSFDRRLSFVQGLLSLLPVPARVGITFATHVQNPQTSLAQIKFMSQPALVDNHVVYDWGNGKLLTPPIEDSYSHYIVAQLRLDPSLVIEQTAELSRTAVWRAQHRENLGRALAWVSRRAAIDQAVREGQPVDSQTVAAILRDDPTLSDDMRLLYTRHLLAFALALDDLGATDVIPTIAIDNPPVAAAVASQLEAAIGSGQAWAIFALLEHWILNIPEGAAPAWYTLLHQAAQRHLAELLEQQQFHQVIEFVNYLKQMPAALRISEIMPDLVRLMQPYAYPNARLAQALFLLAVELLHAGELHRLLSDKAFVKQLPQPLQTALLYLEPEPRQPVPPHVLDAGARAFGDGYRMLVLARLVEWAVFLQRTDLIDTAALQALLVMAQSPRAEQFETLIQHVVEDFSQVSVVQVLEPPGPRILVQLLLQTLRFDQAILLLEFYQNRVFRVERLGDFGRLAGEAFMMTPLAPEYLQAALDSLEGSQIRPEPRAMIYCGALNNRQWAPDQEGAARRLTTMLFNDNTLINAIGHDNTLQLLRFHTRQHNALDALRVGAALVDHTLRLGLDGAVLLVQMWSALTWHSEVSDAALELLRRYVRGVPIEQVPALIGFFGGELGKPVAESLQATYLMRQVIGDADLLGFAEEVHIAAQLCMDVASTYRTGKDLPPNHRLRRDLDMMTGGLSDVERRQVADNVLNITRQIYELGHEYAQKRGRQARLEQLVQGKAVPQNGVDLLYFVGGHFAHRQVIPLNLDREAMAHIFGNRSAAMFLRETNAITRLLGGLQAAFDARSACPVTPQALTEELQSLWSGLSLYNQRRLEGQLAADCQNLAGAIGVMTAQVNDRILSDGGVGRQLETGQRQPRAALEALRWINGYFAHKHIRTRT